MLSVSLGDRQAVGVVAVVVVVVVSSTTTTFATTTARSLLSIGKPWDGRDKLNAGRADRK